MNPAKPQTAKDLVGMLVAISAAMPRSHATPLPQGFRCPQCSGAMRELAHAIGHFTVIYCAACETTFRLAAIEVVDAQDIGNDRGHNVLRFPTSRRAS